MEEIKETKISNPETNLSSSKFHDFNGRIQHFKLIKTLENDEQKIVVWFEFLDLWSDLLEHEVAEALVFYQDFSKLLTEIFEKVNLIRIRRNCEVAMKSCLIAFQQLKHPHIQKYLALPYSQEKKETNLIYYIHCYQILWYSSQAMLFIPRTIQEEKKIVEDQSDLFKLVIERIDKSMPKNSGDAIQKDVNLGDINRIMMSLIWNTSDRTNTVPFLIKCDLIPKLISWLEQANMLNDKSRSPLISIVHNIARHDDGVDQLNMFDIVPLIKNYQELTKVSLSSRLLIGYMALALVSTPEQIKEDRKGMNAVLNSLLQLVFNAGKSDRFRFNGFHVSEPLLVLVKLFVVEERTLDYILCHAETHPQSDTMSTIRFFADLLIRFSENLQNDDFLEQYTIIALLNVVWSISFESDYAEELKTNEKLINLIKRFHQHDHKFDILDQYKPRSMEDFQQATRGILHNLKLDNNNDSDLRSRSEQDRIENNSKPSIMISYSHVDNSFCDQILECLSPRSDSFDIWIDRTHCQGAIDPWESIAEGMEHASVIISLVSDQYFESKSCRQEFIYAVDSLKKTVIPVLIGKFEPKGWLGIRMSGLKYVRFRDVSQPNPKKMAELLEAVLVSLSPDKLFQTRSLPALSTHNVIGDISSPRVSTNAIPLTSTKPVGDDEVSKWFADHNLSQSFYDLFQFQNMAEMIDYGEFLRNDRDNQMKIYSKLYSQKNPMQEMPPHEFIRFSRALQQLNEDRKKTTPQASTDSSTHNQSRACIVL